MRFWAIAALWAVWLAVVATTGYAPPAADDRVDPRATRASVGADLVTLASMALAVGAAVGWPAAAIPGGPWPAGLAGSALVALGLALRRWATRTLGPAFTRSVVVGRDHRVVATGPYRFVRHPAYAGLLLSSVGLALALGNGASVAVMAAGGLAAAVRRVTAEEAALERGVGSPYRDYARDRKRLVPGVW